METPAVSEQGFAETREPMRKPKAFAILVSTFALLWVFAVYAGPWLAERTPVMKEIVQVVEERDINANAYFYSEIEASYDGENYLRESMDLTSQERGKGGFFFFSGVAICVLILWFGFRHLPM